MSKDKPPFKAVMFECVFGAKRKTLKSNGRERLDMESGWREHLVAENDGTMRIRAHGAMKADARLITDAAHMERHADDRGPEQLVNTAAMPGIVGEAWAMADWHYGCLLYTSPSPRDPT